MPITIDSETVRQLADFLVQNPGAVIGFDPATTARCEAVGIKPVLVNTGPGWTPQRETSASNPDMVTHYDPVTEHVVFHELVTSQEAPMIPTRREVWNEVRNKVRNKIIEIKWISQRPDTMVWVSIWYHDCRLNGYGFSRRNRVDPWNAKTGYTIAHGRAIKNLLDTIMASLKED